MSRTLRTLLLLMFLLASSALVGAQQASTTVFVSDLHLGVGQILPGKYANQEDFRWHTEFAALLDWLDSSTSSNVELVFLGDSFELWQSPFQDCSGDGANFSCKARDCRPDVNGDKYACTEAEAQARMRHVLTQHADTIDALSRFARKGTNRIVLVPGNHDAAILLPLVQADVLGKFNLPADRLQLATRGYWVSSDKRIFADHGHMFDKVNKYTGWPEPYENTAHGRVMLRPWGEGMVQEFYNQYEELVPAVDNMTDETTGARLAAEALGPEAKKIALKRFVRFLAHDTTLRQKLDSLGASEGEVDDVDLRLGGEQPDTVPWDFAAIRAGDATRFFVESMALDKARETAAQVAEPISWADVDDEEIAELCEQRRVLIEFYTRNPGAKRPPDAQMAACPQVAGAEANLGYAADKIFRRDLRNRRKYLVSMQAPVGAPFDVYVYGHTHAAVDPADQKLREAWQAKVVNTGAFQRTASVDQVRQLRDKEDKDKPLAQFFAGLTPEKLRPCYPFVRVKPYAAGAKPSAELRWWALSNGSWRELSSCPPWP